MRKSKGQDRPASGKTILRAFSKAQKPPIKGKSAKTRAKRPIAESSNRSPGTPGEAQSAAINGQSAIYPTSPDINDVTIVTPSPNGWRKLSEDDWAKLRREYEGTGRVCSLRYLARREHVHEQMMFRRCRNEGWTKGEQIVRQATRNLQGEAKQKAIAMVEDQLAPWIAKQQSKFTRQTFIAAKRGIMRVAKFQKANRNVDARNEANIAKGFESYARVGRQSLGMDDNHNPLGAVNINVLTTRSAIQINDPDSLGVRRGATPALPSPSQDCE